MKRIALIFLLLCSTALAGYRGDVTKDATNVSLNVFLRGDDDGKGEAGETSATVTCSYTRNGVPVAVPLIDGTIGNHADGGWIATSATLVPGEYQFHAPDAAFATGVNSVVFTFKASGVIDQRATYVLAADVAAGIWDYLVDGAESAKVALRKARAGIAGNSTSSGDPRRTVYMNAAGTDAVTTLTFSGTSRSN